MEIDIATETVRGQVIDAHIDLLEAISKGRPWPEIERLAKKLDRLRRRLESMERK